MLGLGILRLPHDDYVFPMRAVVEVVDPRSLWVNTRFDQVSAGGLAAAQGIDFLRPLQSSAPLEALHAALRAQCASMPADHYLAPDIERANALLWQGGLRAQAAPALAASTQNHAP